MAHEKVLLVEGDEDKRVIPQLVEANGVIEKKTGSLKSRPWAV